MSQNQTENTQVVVAGATSEATHAVNVVDSFTGRNVQVYSSIQDDGTRESKIKIYNAMNEADNKLADMVNKELEVQDLVAFPVEILTDDGELVNAVRMIFITPDGETYASVATGIYSSVQKIIGLVGPAPWTPALRVTPVNQPTRKGFKTLTLRLLS